MNRLAVSLAASAAMFVTTVAPVQAQDGPRTFQRSGSWSLDAGAESCQLARVFSNGDDQIALAMERNRLGNTVRLILVSDAIRTFRAADQFGYAYLPARDQRSAMYIRSETPDGQSYFNLGSIILGTNPFAGFGPGAEGAGDGPPAGPPPGLVPGREPGSMVFAPYDRAAEVEFATGVTGIEFNDGLLQTIRLQTGSLGPVIEALQACTDDLVRSWGLDWEAHQTMTATPEPIGPAWEWIPRGTVGFQDFGAFGGARNPFRVMIDAEGRPTACHVHWASLEEDQNEAICEGIMENGRFHPALDANGEAMASYWMVDYFPALSRPFGQ